MRARLVEELLDAEVRIVKDALASPTSVRVWREGTQILVAFNDGRTGGPGLLRLDCAGFDTEPPSVSMLNPDTREELPTERWTPGIASGIHPLTNKPFVCLQGIAEYHTHPSHTGDSWDRYRYRFRIPQTISTLLGKAGVAR